jgi:hypothetical protein
MSDLVRVTHAQYDVDPRAQIGIEDYNDEGLLLGFGNEGCGMSFYVDDATVCRLLEALVSGAPRLSLQCMNRARDTLHRRIYEHADSPAGQRARLDPGPLA